MKNFKLFSTKYFCIAVLAIVVVAVACHSSSQQTNAQNFVSPGNSAPGQTASPNAPLSANDISWLFPAPTKAADLANLIAVSDVTNQGPIWTPDAFAQFKAIANSAAGQAAPNGKINLPTTAQSVDAWFIAGVRIDAGAPGLSSDIHAQYGQLPEIRLIIQPIVKAADGTPTALDIAGHLIFDFITTTPDPSLQGADCFLRPVADTAAFNSVIADVVALRNKLNAGQLAGHAVNTAGVPLGIHPGLADPQTVNAVRNEMLAFLKKNLVSQRLGSMAIAGLPSPAPEPWIFLSILGDHQGHFGPVHGPTLDGTQFAQLLNPQGSPKRVDPVPSTNNLNPITCRNAAVSPTSLPVAQRNGVSTSAVFANSAMPADQSKQILDTVADPTKSFFFNTDCVSCHTETRLTMQLQNVKQIPGINSAALPNGPWDVRNFGWGEAGGAGVQPTVTRRTANETAAVLNAVNAQLAASPH